MKVKELIETLSKFDPEETVHLSGEWDSILNEAFYEPVGVCEKKNVPYYTTKTGYKVPYVEGSRGREDGKQELIIIGQY